MRVGDEVKHCGMVYEVVGICGDWVTIRCGGYCMSVEISVLG